MTSWIKDQLF